MGYDLQFLRADDVTELGALPLSATAPGPTGATVVHVWNQLGGSTADAVLSPRLRALARNPGDVLPVAAGLPVLDERWVEARITGLLGAAAGEPSASSWTPLGTGRWLLLPDLPASGGVAIEIRLNVPGYVTTAVAAEVSFGFDLALALPLGLGGSETSPDGVLSGLGDGAYTALAIGGSYAPTGTPGDSVEAPYLSWIAGGIPYALEAATLTPGPTDGDGASLSGGEGYWILYSLAPGGTRRTTKGSKAIAGAAVKPALPAGDVCPVYVLRDSTAVIEAGAIVNGGVPGRFSLAAAGLAASLSPGSARQDNRLYVSTYSRPLPLVASSTNQIWLSAGGLKPTVSADPKPDVRAMLLWEVDTDGSGVTAIRDRRRLIGGTSRRRKLRFNSTLAGGNDSDLEVVEELEPLLLDPERPLFLALDTLGSGNTSGTHRVDVQVLADDGTPASIFPDTASMPQIPYDGTVPVARSSRPTTLVIPAGARLRARIDAIPSGGSAAAGATVAVGG